MSHRGRRVPVTAAHDRWTPVITEQIPDEWGGTAMGAWRGEL